MRLPFTVIAITYAIAMTGLLIIPGVDDQGNPYHLTIFESFYFITYTATTIGFGELPYAFTNAQKIWVSMSIYITVIGWFYSIGSLIRLSQDKLFLSEIALSRFKRAVKHIKEDFVIVLGYNETTSIIIKKLLNANMRVVVIERDEKRADYLNLEGFTPYVPVLVRDVHNTSSLEYAGITSIHCKCIISLLDSGILNLRVTIASKILNPHVRVAVKSSTQNETGNLLDVGADIVENPFSIIANQIQMAVIAPSLFKLENWLYNIDTLNSKTFSIPNEKIIICGFGRFGLALHKMFTDNSIYPTIIELDEEVVKKAQNDGVKNIIQGNAEDKFSLNEANITNTNLIIIGTSNDTINLSIVSTVKKMNKNTIIISRENELLDFSIFSHAKIDYIFLPSRILIHKTTNAIINPLSDIMIRLIANKNESWGKHLLSLLMKHIDSNPITFELGINKYEAIEIYKYLKDTNNKITFETLKSSRRNRYKQNNLLPLLIIREKEKILLPDLNFELQLNDKILFACDENAKNDLEYIANNIYDFHYIITGEEKQYFSRFINFNKRGKK
jgi:Trk K+ transport system NAD-binding subunit